MVLLALTSCPSKTLNLLQTHTAVAMLSWFLPGELWMRHFFCLKLWTPLLCLENYSSFFKSPLVSWEAYIALPSQEELILFSIVFLVGFFFLGGGPYHFFGYNNPFLTSNSHHVKLWLLGFTLMHVFDDRRIFICEL